jgi:hypothetical protein
MTPAERALLRGIAKLLIQSLGNGDVYDQLERVQLIKLLSALDVPVLDLAPSAPPAPDAAEPLKG